MFAVGGRGADQRGYEVAHGTVGGYAGVDAAGQALRNFLEDPTVTVGIVKYGARTVSSTIGIRAALEPFLPEVEDFAVLGAGGEQLFASAYDIGDNEVACGGAGAADVSFAPN